MGNFLNKLFRVDKKRLAKIELESLEVLKHEEEMAALSDDELKAKTPYFKELLTNGHTLEDIKFEAYAVAREAAKRVLHEFPYKVQVMGALVLHEGDVAEMKTGEGKTLTATMAVYLNALEGKGVHIITVNEYLAKRDAEWMGNVYRFLGLTVGVNVKELSPSEKREAYNCDITYSTGSEVGFDYLRDNRVLSLKDKVLRELNFALVDECDSILIDEGRVPLIISAGKKDAKDYYVQADKFVKSLKGTNHYEIDEKSKTVALSESGVKYAERCFNLDNLFSLDNTALVHHINQALRANYIMKRDVDYAVIKGEVLIIDQFTGRLMKGREWSDGLHQAVCAKECVKINQETVTCATITYQNFFRLYKKLSGMTGTAKTEEEELKEIYNMRVVEIPTNKPIQRIDDTDLVYNTKEAKYKALIEEIVKRHEQGQPILVGTASVDVSELLSEKLKKIKIKHEVLNAKNHEREADIVALAGQKGAVTIATNMAGRGTDIKLGEGVRELGGLAVLGSERNDSRRVDNQLRGRSGRQGDPGYSRFYVSMEDDLMKRFGNLQDNKLFMSLGEEAIDSKIITKLISSAQVRVEGSAFDSRKYVLKYDEVLRQQREIMYKQRDDILGAGDIKKIIEGLITKAAKFIVNQSIFYDDGDPLIDVNKMKKLIAQYLALDYSSETEIYKDGTINEDGVEELSLSLFKRFETVIEGVDKEVVDTVLRQIAISIVDEYWVNHIDRMQKLKDGVGYMSYAQVDPLNSYVNDGYKMFQNMSDLISLKVTRTVLNIKIHVAKESAV